MEQKFELDRDMNKWKFVLVLPLNGDHPDYKEVKERLSEVIGEFDNDDAYFTHRDEKELSEREE